MKVTEFEQDNDGSKCFVQNTTKTKQGGQRRDEKSLSKQEKVKNKARILKDKLKERIFESKEFGGKVGI